MNQLKPKEYYFDIINIHYSRIGKPLELFWGTEEFYSLMDKLINDSRNGKRVGFPLPVADALLKLNRIHMKEFG